MATTQSRVQFNLSAKDQTAAAFASVRRGLDSLNRSANQLKGLFAGALGGATIAKGIRELIAISAETEPVRKSFDRLKMAMEGFARQVGDSGFNSALVFFADRLGAMVYGSDSLANSIGALLGGGVRVLAVTFEGIGRAIAFVYDNMTILGNYLMAFGIVMFAQRILAGAAAFYYFAKTIQATGLVMGAFNLIAKASTLKFVLLAGVMVYATGQAENFRSAMQAIYDTAESLLPQVGEVAGDVLETLGLDMSALTTEIGKTSSYLSSLGPVTMGASGAVATLGKTTTETAAKISGLNPTVKSAGDTMKNTMEGLGESVSQSLGDTIEGVVGGTMKLKEAWRSMAASIVKDLQNIASAMIRSGITSLVAGALGGGGGGGLGSMNFGGPRASGGPVMAGRSYVVGEHRAELFTPTSNGYITPKVGGGGGLNFQPVYNIDARGSSAESVQQLQAQLNARDAQLRRELPGLIRMARQGGKI